MDIKGVGPDSPMVTTQGGGKQSDIPYRCDLFPAGAYLHVSAILAEGAKKYSEWNWVNVPFGDHINHVLTHIKAYGAGDRSDDHIGHAACRMMMALELLLDMKDREREANEAANKPRKFGF